MPEEAIDTLLSFGELMMPQSGSETVMGDAPVWTSTGTASVLALAGIVLLITNIKNILGVFPDLVEGILGRRGFRSVDYSLRSQQKRDASALCMIVPFGLIIFKYGLFPLELTDSFPEWTLPLASLGTFLAWLLVRWFIEWQLAPVKGSKDVWKASSKAFWNFFIFLVLVQIAEVGIFYVFGVENGTASTVLYVTICLFYGLYIVRRGRIMGQGCGPFAIILYLCALEFLPTAMLVAATVYL